MNLPDHIKSWTESIMWMYVMPNTGPIYLACRYTDVLTALLAQWKKEHKAAYDFTEEDEITHHVWVIDEDRRSARSRLRWRKFLHFILQTDITELLLL